MNRNESSGRLGEILIAFEQAVGSVEPGSLPAVLGALERLKALAWGRALESVSRSPSPWTGLDELRHLTPLRVAELLSVKEAYVHELCRSGRIPATKEGKYWLIPVTALHEWLAKSRQRVDRGLRQQLTSPGANDVPAAHLARHLTGNGVTASATLRAARTPGSRRTPPRDPSAALRRIEHLAGHGIGAMKSTNRPQPSEATPAAARVQPDSQ
jgi:excisionase family DNA binding protein